MLKAFKAFVLRGNVMDMAVGVIVGAAFGTIVKSLVEDVLMPPIGLLTGGLDFSNLFVVLKEGGKAAGPYASLVDAKAAGAVTLNYGAFVNTVVAFLIVAVCIFMVVQAVGRLQQPAPAGPPTTKDCPFCKTSIPIAAVRCPHCTSELKTA